MTHSEVLTWPEQILREAPDYLFERTGNTTRDRRTRESLTLYLKKHKASPSLLELDAERKRRQEES